MDPNEQLRNIVKWKRKPRADRITPIGVAVNEVMDRRVTPLHERFESIAGVWSQLLPDGLRRHCKVVEILGGQLSVQVDSGAYLYELRMCSSQLLAELKRQCRGAGIKKIKFVIKK